MLYNLGLLKVSTDYLFHFHFAWCYLASYQSLFHIFRIVSMCVRM